MTRIFTDGAESGDTGFWTVATNVSISTSIKRSGARSYALTSSSSCYKSIPSAIAEGFVRFGFYTDFKGAGATFFAFRSGSTNLLSILINATTHKMVITHQSGTITSTTAFADDTHYLVEVRFKIDNSVGEVELRVDGVTVGSFSGDTFGSIATFDNIYFTNNAQVALYIDDIAFNDIIGGNDNSWCGDGKIIALVPNGNGYSSQWVNNSGSSVNNYLYIDEQPPSDSDYVRATGSSYIDAYDLSTFDVAGQTIQRVWIVSRAKSDVAGDYFLQGIRVSGSNYLVTGSLPTSFGRIDISATGTWNVNPFTNNPWTQEQLDSLVLVIQSP